MSLLKTEAVCKNYKKGLGIIQALENISLEINAGESISIVGPSGSGKSTLLNILGLLDIPDSGVYMIGNQNTRHLSDLKLARLRANTFGFVFQSFNLIPKLTALQNVMLPMQFGNLSKKMWVDHAKDLLEKVGLGERLHHKPTELSGGQEQRVAIARALANKPKVILADEPTGNLDSDSGKQILELLLSFPSNECAVIIVTHDLTVAKQTSRSVVMQDGRILRLEFRAQKAQLDS